MKRIVPGILLFYLTASLICLLSCAQGSCFEETESYLKASLYSDRTEKPEAPDSLTAFGLDRDTAKIYNSEQSIVHAKLPLDNGNPETSFVIRINGISDTVIFRYNSYPHFISKECGYTYYHQLDTEPITTHHIIKSIVTESKTITTLNVENVRIFY